MCPRRRTCSRRLAHHPCHPVREMAGTDSNAFSLTAIPPCKTDAGQFLPCNLNPVVVLKDVIKSGIIALPFETPPCTPCDKKSSQSTTMTPPTVASESPTSTATAPRTRSPTSVRPPPTVASPASLKSTTSTSSRSGSPDSITPTPRVSTHSLNSPIYPTFSRIYSSCPSNCPDKSPPRCLTPPQSHCTTSSPCSSPSPLLSPCSSPSPSYSSVASNTSAPSVSSSSSAQSSGAVRRRCRFNVKRTRCKRKPARPRSSALEPEPEPEFESGSESDGAPADAFAASVPHPGPAPPASKRVKRRRRTWDPSVEYEIEEIVGYHRNRRQRMWYLVKWKDWPSEYNTFEPIENLTGCHYELMRYFEVVLPSTEELQKKGAEVSRGLKDRDIYKRLKSGNYAPADLEKFSQDCLDLKPLFRTADLDELEKHMTREYEYILRTLIGMYAHQDKGLIRRAQNYKLFLKLIKVRRRQLAKNALIEKVINAREHAEVTIENNQDMDAFPEINYISEMKIGQGVVVSEEPVLGCECPGGCNPRSHCCGKISYSTFAYGNNDRLRITDRVAIYECNSSCRCLPTCSNRVVQRGRQVKLCVFKTELCGWGVKAMQMIPKGTFVCEYIGELIPDSVAVVRDLEYYAQDRSGYLFDLDFFEDPNLEMYCIDATAEGNLARFINHSCDPNLVVYPVWINCLAPNIHRLAFFAKRNIRKGEEIHFDYENLQENPREGKGSHWSTKMACNLRCHCRAENCRQWVFGNK